MHLLKFALLASLGFGCNKASVDKRASVSEAQDALDQEKAIQPRVDTPAKNPETTALSYEEMLRLVSMAPVTLKFEKNGSTVSPESFVVEYICQPGLSITLTEFARELPSTDSCYGVLRHIRLSSRSYVPRESFLLLDALFSEGQDVTYFSPDGRSLVIRTPGIARAASPDLPRGILFEILEGA